MSATMQVLENAASEQYRRKRNTHSGSDGVSAVPGSEIRIAENRSALRTQPAPAQFDSGNLPRFPRNASHSRSSVDCCADSDGPARSPRGDYWTGREKDGDQRVNSGANVFMADFEDSNAPTWSNCLEGQRNLRDANLRKIDLRHRKASSTNKAEAGGAVCAAAGWHMVEKHFRSTDSRFQLHSSIWAVLLSQFSHAARAQYGSVFLFAQIGKPPGSALMERCVLFAQEYVGIPRGPFALLC